MLWPVLLSLAEIWGSNRAYQYAWLGIPLIVYLLAWRDREATLSVRPQPGFGGIFLTIAAALSWVVADLINIDVVRQFAFVLAFHGVCLSALGWRAYWKLFPVLGLTFLMIPSGDLWQPLLRSLTVKVIALVASVAQLPHSVDGFYISIGEASYVVLDECAGLSHFLLGTFLGYVLGLLLFRSFWKVTVLAIFGALIGILSNTLRVGAIILVDWVQGSQMPLTGHTDIQWVALLLCLGLLFAVFSKLDEEAIPAKLIVAQPDRAAKLNSWAPVLAGFAVILIVSGWNWRMGQAAPTDAQTTLFPENLARWKLASPTTPWSIKPQNNTRLSTATYRSDGMILNVIIIEPMSPEIKLSESDVGPRERNAWFEKNVSSQTGCAGSNCSKLLHTVWIHRETGQYQHIYWTYALGSFLTHSKLAIRAKHGWNTLIGNPSNPRLIGFTLDSALDAQGIDELAAAFRSLNAASNAPRGNPG